MSRHNGLPGFDAWLTREPDDDCEEQQQAVFTEDDLINAVEDMRAKCQEIAQEYAARGHGVAIQIVERIIKLSRPS